MWRLTYKEQELDQISDEETVENVRTCRAIHAAFMGVRPGDIDMTRIETSTDFLNTRQCPICSIRGYGKVA